MADKLTYYEILGVSRDSSEKEVSLATDINLMGLFKMRYTFLMLGISVPVDQFNLSPTILYTCKRNFDERSLTQMFFKKHLPWTCLSLRDDCVH